MAFSAVTEIMGFPIFVTILSTHFSLKVEKQFLREVPFGGGCVNDTIIHIATNNLPFGGVGNSGMGSYHGKKTFETFSHAKSVVKKYTWLDISMRYQPYASWKDKLIRMFLK